MATTQQAIPGSARDDAADEAIARSDDGGGSARHLAQSDWTGRSANDFVLAGEIGATPAERRVLSTLGIRRNGAGSLPALRTAARAAAAAAKCHPSSRAAEWVAILRALADRVATAVARAPWLDMPCPVIGHRAVCDVLADPVRCSLPVDARERLDAWLGIHVFHALARGGMLSVAVLEDWETLRRTGVPRSNTPASWISAAKDMPLDVAEINRILPTTRQVRLRDALKLTLVALAADIPAPDTVTNLGAADVTTEPGAWDSNGEAYRHDNAADEDEDDDEEEETPLINPSDAKRHSLMGLHRHGHQRSRGSRRSVGEVLRAGDQPWLSTDGRRGRKRVERLVTMPMVIWASANADAAPVSSQTSSQ